ncbi:uncharacterized protein METZ01_LOCUS70912 [marine metagenome]|uniref:Uncharacterized protein n=1 Tax=marine metagenome TaxID=408172 RepID=A0A381TRB1_9ZZZZ
MILKIILVKIGSGHFNHENHGSKLNRVDYLLHLISALG